MKKCLTAMVLFLYGYAFSQPVFSEFTENGKKGIKNEKGETVIPADYKEIINWQYFGKSGDTLAIHNFFVAVREGEAEEKIFYDSSSFFNYDYEVPVSSPVVRKVRYKVVKNGTLDVYGNDYRKIVENISDFGYDLVMEVDSAVLPGFYLRKLSDELMSGYFGFSYRFIDNFYPSLYRKNGKWGMINKNTGRVTEAVYDSIVRDLNFNELMVYKEGKAGIAGNEGEIIIPPLYDGIYSLGLSTTDYFTFTVKKNGKYGAVKAGNKVIVPVEFEAVIPVNENYIIVNKGGKIIRKDERLKLADYYDYEYMPATDQYFNFSDSLIIGGKFGVFDTNGNNIIAVKHDYLEVSGNLFNLVKGGKEKTEIYAGSGGEFYYGYYDLAPGTTYAYSHYRFNEKPAGGKSMYVNRQGKKVFKGIDSVSYQTTVYDYLNYNQASNFEYYYLAKGKKAGIANENTEIIVPVEYDLVSPRIANNEGKQLVYFEVTKGDLLGLFSGDGKELLPAKFNILYFSSNQYSGYGYYGHGYEYDYYNPNSGSYLNFPKDTVPKTVIIAAEGGKKKTIRYEGLTEWDMGEYSYEIYTGLRYSVFDAWGNKLTREFFDTIYADYGSDVLIVRKFGKYGLMDLKGSQFARCEYDNITPMGNGAYAVYKNGMAGLLTLSGLLIPIEYDGVYRITNDLFRLNRSNLMGLYSLSKGMVLPVEYSYLYKDYYQDYIMISQHEKYGLADITGAVLLPCEYDAIEINAYGFSPALAKFTENGNIGLYNKFTREIILEPSLSFIDDTFGGRYMKVNKGGEALLNEWGEMIGFTGGKSGVIDSSGRIMVPALYDNVSYLNSETGLFRAMNNGLTAEYFDTLGKKITNGEQLWANSFIGRMSKRKNEQEIKITSASGPFGCDATAFYTDRDGNYWLGTGSSGGVFFSSDQGNTWQPRNKGIGPVHVYMIHEMNDTLFLLANQYTENSVDYYYLEEIIDLFYYDVISQQWLPFSSKEMDEETYTSPFYYDLDRIKTSKAEYDSLMEASTGRSYEVIGVNSEAYVNNEGYYDYYNMATYINYSCVARKIYDKEDTLRKNIPKDMYYLYGKNYAYGKDEDFLLAKSGVYRMPASGVPECVNEDGMLATDISQTLTLPGGRIIAKEGSCDIWQLENGKWARLFNFYEYFNQNPPSEPGNLKTGIITSDKQNNIYFCAGENLFKVSPSGNLSVIFKTDTLKNIFQSGTTEVKDYGNVLEHGYYSFTPVSAGRDKNGKLNILGKIRDVSYYTSYANYYALAILDEKTGKLDFPYGAIEQSSNEPVLKSNNGEIYFFTNKFISKPGDETFAEKEYYLQEYALLDFKHIGFSPAGDLALTSNNNRILYYESAAKKWHDLEYNDKKIVLTTVGFDDKGNLYGATGFNYMFYCGGPGELTSEAMLYRAKFTDMGIEWEKIKNDINSKIISIGPHSQFGILLGSSGSGLLLGK